MGWKIFVVVVVVSIVVGEKAYINVVFYINPFQMV